MLPYPASRTGRLMNASIRIAAAALVLSAPAWSQTMDHAHMGMASPAAQKEIAAVESAVRSLGSENAAAAGGFRPVFGWLPTMGVHWVKQPLMTKGAQSDRTSPSNLMF